MTDNFFIFEIEKLYNENNNDSFVFYNSSFKKLIKCYRTDQLFYLWNRLSYSDQLKVKSYTESIDDGIIFNEEIRE